MEKQQLDLTAHDRPERTVAPARLFRRTALAFALWSLAHMGLAQLPLVKLGIAPSNSDRIQVQLRPDQTFSGAVTGTLVTVRWKTTPGVTVHHTAATYNDPDLNGPVGPLAKLGVFTHGDSSYAVFSTVYGGHPLSDSSITWAANTDVPFFSIPFTNTSGTCVTFEVANSAWQADNNYQWFVSLNAQERTDGYIPGEVSFCADPIGMKLGITPSGSDKIQVKLRPDQSFNGAVTGTLVSVRWKTTTGVTVHHTAAAYNDPDLNGPVGPLAKLGVFTHGDSSYAVFSTVYGGHPLSDSSITWAANTDVPFLSIPFTNTSGTCVTFEVANSAWQADNNYQWFVSLNAQERTDGYIPGEASFCADPIGVKLGITPSGSDKIQVKLRPDQSFSEMVTGAVISVRWPTTPGLTVHGGSASYNNPSSTTTIGGLAFQGVFVDGAYSHAVYSIVGASDPVSWTANTDIALFTIPFTNTSGSCVTFEVVDSPWQADNNYQWFVSLNAQERTDGYIPGEVSFCADPIGMKLGITPSASDKIQVKLRPDQSFNGAVTGSLVSVRWKTTPGVTVHHTAASYNDPLLAGPLGTLDDLGVFVNGDSSYAVFSTVYGGAPLSSEGISWAANTDVSFFTIPFTNTSGACVAFEVADSPWQADNNYQWFVSLNAQERTDGYIPGEASFCAAPNAIQLTTRAYLEGAWMSDLSLMRDSLRVLGLIPFEHPYTPAPFAHAGTEQIAPSVLSTSGTNAVVDWVLLELRAAGDPATVVASRAALIQRDGDIVDVDGTSAVVFPVGPGTHHLVVRHRNHLGVMTAAAITMDHATPAIDLTAFTTTTHGIEARKDLGGPMAMWCGNSVADATVKYQGAGNDREAILSAIGGVVPTNTISGYLPTDVTMDGKVRYLGALNDREAILSTIGGSVPTNVRQEQLP